MDQRPQVWLVVTTELPRSLVDREQVLEIVEHRNRQNAIAEFEYKRAGRNVRRGVWRVKVVEAT
ncbi:hypothetical protein [Longispora sp. NPDC051575]|uniref:hypothetical protein n=1 Tax=Longispora sp. NPDC051575 TaxID=3154943 RepID=UPI0034496BC4